MDTIYKKTHTNIWKLCKMLRPFLTDKTDILTRTEPTMYYMYICLIIIMVGGGGGN